MHVHTHIGAVRGFILDDDHIVFRVVGDNAVSAADFRAADREVCCLRPPDRVTELAEVEDELGALVRAARDEPPPHIVCALPYHGLLDLRVYLRLELSL